MTEIIPATAQPDKPPGLRVSQVLLIIFITILMTGAATFWFVRSYIYAPDFEPVDKTQEPAKEIEKIDIEPDVIDNNSFPTKDQQTSQFESELVLPDAQDSLVDDFAAETGIDPVQPADTPRGEPELAPQPDPQTLLQAANATRRLADGQPMPVVYRLRTIANRREIAKLRGGSDETEDAVEAALHWLAKTQKEDGRWCPVESGSGREDKIYGHDRGGCGSQSDMGITALATLSFLGAGHSHLEGKIYMI